MRSLLLSLLVFFSSVSLSMAPKLNWDKAIDKAVYRYGLKTEPDLMRSFAQAKVAYPPQEVALLAFKKERQVELWAKNDNQSWAFIKYYPLTAFSGRLGPKLKERDRQIPEGIYRLITFNPFSSMHLSMMIDYPNHFDRLQAAKDGRKNLGNNIFLHGKSFSVGCLAVGDRAIDQLFLLARRVGLNHIKVIIAPNDLRIAKPATSSFAQPRWLPELYKQISSALDQFPATHKKMMMATK
ncbi:L,D-transpeptidase family protein [Legionella jamestowniensis]|uniref:Legionella secretion system protein A n=2 Tax=Legionella jamestowniensis TaxID=455 RepID=A0A0W0UKJ9_9GAMM|nr:L,D-transpeptidase family protein [Legionella jamestowniensis]KTD08231.1 Legionella secretion system protein A [Legionella jamestowniensis]SFL98136.1 L,D-transpeptidase catalytic domain [Legionella jamestowniensis DSM 19215]